MKKFLTFIIMLFVGILSVGCASTDNPTTNQTETETETVATTTTTIEKEVVKFTIFSLNDLHGAIYESEGGAGISKTGNYLIEQKESNPDTTIILSGGDMFQGTAVSSMTRGQAVTDIMNIIGFDAMAIGNHEFDWGVNQLLKLHDGNLDNGEAEFPFLAANIVYKETQEQVEWSVPYIILEKSGVKIGVIGLIGEEQITDILGSIVAPYEFSDQVTAVKKYASELRNDKGCEIIIVATHDGGTDMDSNYNVRSSIVGKLAALEGEYRVDVVLNAHTHRTYAGEYSTANHNVPYIQSGSNGYYIGKIELEYDKTSKQIIDVSAENIRTIYTCDTESAAINQAISKYQSYVDLAQSVLAQSTNYYSRQELAYWASGVLMDKTNSDVAIINFGGIRTSIDEGDVSYGKVFQIFPFENSVIKITLTGAQLKTLTIAGDGDLAIVSNYSTYESSQIYNVTLIDYVFEKVAYQPIFSSAANVQYTGEIFREWAAQAVIDSATNNNGYFEIN